MEKKVNHCKIKDQEGTVTKFVMKVLPKIPQILKTFQQSVFTKYVPHNIFRTIFPTVQATWDMFEKKPILTLSFLTGNLFLYLLSYVLSVQNCNNSHRLQIIVVIHMDNRYAFTKKEPSFMQKFCTNGKKVAIQNDNSSTNRKVNDCYSILTKLLFATNVLKKYLSYFYGKRSCYFLMKCCSVNYTTQMHFPCRTKAAFHFSIGTLLL